MLLSGKCCSQIFDLDEPVEDVLRACARLLGLDVDEVVGSSTLLHGTSVVTDLRNDLEALTTKFGPPPLPPLPKLFFPSGFSVHVPREGLFRFGVFGISSVFPLQKATRERHSFVGCGGGVGS